ncbi:response regulator transcription factor [Pseudoalteromonas porphyrae]|uniref:Transcriptional regulator n=1 Tax=Pseudoalteromonas porphyrae TaxID=187330 RepID=A0A0N0M0A4_9GAMM|nr:response regulator transcription factor [Pseudoalteromonas porphyrae]KPH63838.1 transcriptional regulator [Pseudoalteromonas porphyrae]
MIILLVEDDAILAQQAITFLENEGIEVDYARSLAQAKGICVGQHYDAIILDINLPDGTGLSLAQQWRDTNTAPILFLTARCALEDKLAAFAAGALDYLTKPFALEELVIRIKLLAKKHSCEATHFNLDTLSIDLEAKIIKRAQRTIILSPQQWTLVALLLRHSPAPVSKEMIINTVWPDKDVNNNMYKSLLTRLRTNLTKDDEVELLHTLKKQGVALRLAND